MLKQHLFPNKPPAYYGIGNRYFSVQHTCLRLGHNLLNFHLHRIGTIQSPSCRCETGTETEFHFLISCPLYIEARQKLFTSIQTFVSPSLNFLNILHNSPRNALKLLLYGSDLLTEVININIFTEVYRFLEESGRFDLQH